MRISSRMKIVVKTLSNRQAPGNTNTERDEKTWGSISCTAALIHKRLSHHPNNLDAMYVQFCSTLKKFATHFFEPSVEKPH